MQSYVQRKIEDEIFEDLNHYPAIAILGPRQCGKTTTALNILSRKKNSVYLDMEKSSDLRKLEDPELFFSNHKNDLVCLDEIQCMPDIFPILRSILDVNKRNGQILILGSASRDLIKQSSETLAGRIVYKELTPFLCSEIKGTETQNLWLKGGFPRSYLEKRYEKSVEWRHNFIKTFIERDIPQLGFNIPANTLKRLWTMCGHLHGQILNSSRLGESLGLSHTTIRSYIDLLEQAFVLKLLLPYEMNVKKRIVKSPKIYVRDSGLLHALLNIKTIDDLLGHPVCGASWEGFVIENILSNFRGWNGYFYRTSYGSEIDLVLEKGRKRIAIECKASTAPIVSKGFYNAFENLNIEAGYIVAPVKEKYPLSKNLFVIPLYELMKILK